MGEAIAAVVITAVLAYATGYWDGRRIGRLQGALREIRRQGERLTHTPEEAHDER